MTHKRLSTEATASAMDKERPPLGGRLKGHVRRAVVLVLFRPMKHPINSWWRGRLVSFEEPVRIEAPTVRGPS
jgi:hypothetical protein